jgi:hypothetical protein
MARGNGKGNTHNAGRKKDGVNLPKFESYFTVAEAKEFVDFLKKRARKSDKIATFVAEHMWGKAFQPVGNPDGSPLTITFDSAFKQ